MNKETFQEHMTRAADSAVDFARNYVLNELPNKRKFLVHPNQSCDEDLSSDEETYPKDSQPDDQPILFTTAEAVVDYLWRNNKIPEWIDISVDSEDGEHTYLQLLCCGRFTETEELLYHRDGGLPPFSIKSPVLPPGYDDSMEGSSHKFDVNWREKAKREFQEKQRTEEGLLRRVLHSMRSLFRCQQ